MKSPKLTAEWDTRLKCIERGQQTAFDFMSSINDFVASHVKESTAPVDEYKALFQSNKQSGVTVGKCPRCGHVVEEKQKGFFCGNRACKFGLFKDKKFFTSKKQTITKDVATALLSDGRVFINGLISEKTGKPYNASILLDDNGEGYPSFKMEFENHHGYKIAWALRFDTGDGFAFGVDRSAAFSLAIWQFSNRDGNMVYLNGHFFALKTLIWRNLISPTGQKSTSQIIRER